MLTQNQLSAPEDQSYAQFNRANAVLWSKIPANSKCSGLLLVEPQSHPIILHSNAVFARIIKQARGLRIGWIDSRDPQVQSRLLSYDHDSQMFTLPQLSIQDLTVAGPLLRAAATLKSPEDIVRLMVDNVRIGDIVYDIYLARFQKATIRRIDDKVLWILFSVIRSYYRFRRLIAKSQASAVLVSHEVGASGLLMRAALGMGRSVFLRRSNVSLNLKRSLVEIYESSFRPRDIDMREMSTLGSEFLEQELSDLMRGRVFLGSDEDASRAYGAKRIYRSKRELAEQFSLSCDAPFVFVMLHAFNDHPHSHFGSMLFQDYYRWFAETLEFAKQKGGVNWIFKEHPSAECYPTRDIDLASHFDGVPSNVLFLDRNANFSSESLVHTADAIVTACGTAGIEFAASAAIPAVMTGRALYTGFGFTIEPSTKDEYFAMLGNLRDIPPLTPGQQSIARRVFLFSERYSSVPFSWAPECEPKAERDPNLNQYYWERVLSLYEKQSRRLLEEFWEYVRQVRDPEFSRLARWN